MEVKAKVLILTHCGAKAHLSKPLFDVMIGPFNPSLCAFSRNFHERIEGKTKIRSHVVQLKSAEKIIVELERSEKIIVELEQS